MIKISNQQQVFLIYILLAVVTFAVYCGVLYNGFINFDDADYITKNYHVQQGLTLSNIKWAFISIEAANWHPLTWLSHMLDCQIFGQKARGHHLVNLLLHTINVLLLFSILKIMTGRMWQSAFVATIFAVHPLNVESVAWIAERKNVLSTIFWFLTIWGYYKYVKSRSVGWYITTLFLFALGLMAKPMLVTIPLVLLVVDYWPVGRFDGIQTDKKQLLKLIIEKTPFFILSAASCVITIAAQRTGGAIAKMDILPLTARLANAVVSYGRYIAKMFWPNKLAVIYPLELKDLTVLKVAGSVSLIIIISILAIALSRKYKYLLTGWLFYLITLLPVIGLVQVGEQSIADRYTYVPLIGLFVIIVWWAADILRGLKYQKIIAGAAAVIIIACLSVKTFGQLQYWKNGITLFEHTIKVTKNNSLAYYSLGFSYFTDGNFMEAKEAFGNAIRIKPNYAAAYDGWGGAALSYLSQNKENVNRQQLESEIKEKLLKAESIKAGSAAYNLGCFYALLGDKENCRRWLKVGEKAGTLVTKKYAMSDKDLESVRNEEWFRQIHWSDDAD